MSGLRRILTLVAKEFAMILRDPKSRFVVIVPPLVQFFVFGYAATFDLSDLRYAVLDESRTPASRALLARFEGAPVFHRVATLQSQREIRQTLDPQKARMVVHVPADFSERLYGGRGASLQVIVDGRNSNVAALAQGYVNAVVQDFNAGLAARADPAPAAVARVVDRAWFNPNLESRWYIVSALGGVISMVVVMILAALSVAREREFGTFDQLQVAPFRQYEILIGKAMPGLVFGVADAVLLSTGAVYWFGVPFLGTPAALLAALGAFVIAIVGVGLFISSICMTMQQALLGSFVFVMPAVILGGLTTPIENMPDWLQTATLINPLRFVVAALRQVFLMGADTAAIWPQLWPLLVIASVTLPLAGWMFRRRTG